MAREAQVASPRRSDIVYVVARFAADDEEYFLFHAHPKWGDWGLVGGHVEAGELHDWTLAAHRETEEEMDPLQVGIDVVLEPILSGPERWGPEPSRSAGDVPTVYSAKWFSLRFLRDPDECFRRLPANEFLLVARARLEARVDSDLTSLIHRLAGALGGGLDDVPLAWEGSLPASVARRELPSSRRVPVQQTTG